MNSEFERLFAMNEEDLLATVGRSVSRDGQLGASSDNSANAERARVWLQANRKKICSALSASARVRELLAQSTLSNRIVLAAACFDVLTMIFQGVPVAAISVQIVRSGIREVCDPEITNWPIPDSD